MTTNGFVNLSSWTVTFSRGHIGWTWKASHADGSELRSPGAYIAKDRAESDAIEAMERHERGEDREEISGFDLRARVAERRERDSVRT